MNCIEARELIEDALDRKVSGPARRKLDLHLSRCKFCRAFFAAEHAEHNRWYRELNDPSVPHPTLPSDFADRLARSVTDKSAHASVLSRILQGRLRIAASIVLVLSLVGWAASFVTSSELVGESAVNGNWIVDTEASQLKDTEGNWVFSIAISDKKLTIKGVVSGSGDLNLRGLPDGYKVVDVGAAFKGRTTLTSFIEPDELTKLAGGAFQSCTALTNWVGGGAVTTCEGANHFMGCGKLSGTLEFPLIQSVPMCFAQGAKVTSVAFTNATSIGHGAFKNCTALTNFIYTAGRITSFANQSFESTALMGDLYLPEVTMLEGSCFFKTKLTSVYAPKVKTIGNAFYFCTSLTNFVGGTETTSLGENAFAGCSKLLIDLDFPLITSIGAGCASESAITSFSATNVVSVANSAFKNAKSMTNFTYTASRLKTIGPMAFESTKIEGRYFFPALTSMDSSAFYRTKISSFAAPQLTDLRGNVFNGCGSLKSVYLPGLMKFTDSGWFQSASLTNIWLGPVATIPGSAFKGSVVTGASVHFMGAAPTFGSESFNAAKTADTLMRFYVHDRETRESWVETCFALRGDPQYVSSYLKKGVRPANTIGLARGNSDNREWGWAWVIDANAPGFFLFVR